MVGEAPPELEATLRAGLELDPERRIASVEAFAKALGSPLIGGQGVPLALSVERPDRSRTLMEQIVRTAAGVFDASACSIGLVDAMTGELVYQSAWGAGAKEIVGVRLAPGTGIGGTAVATGRAEAVDCRNDPRFAAQIAEGTGYVPYTMLVVPLIRDERPVGVLSLLDRRDGGMYGPEDMDRASLFADLALTALDVEPSEITNPEIAFAESAETAVPVPDDHPKQVESAGDIRIGEMVGGYRVEAMLGAGGMGYVYRAAGRGDAQVAIKLIKREMAADATFRRRFEREAAIARGTSHPNLVPVLDVGEHEGVPYMVQRFVGNGTLADRVARHGQLPLADVVRVCLQVAGALDALHAGGVIHRDLKPANILFDEDEVAYLTDFGLAKYGEGTLLTRPGQALGSINYMAPEQVRGDDVSAATDVYGLGCTVFECVTGVPLFADREGMDVLYAQLDADPPDPRAAQPELPEEAGAVILRALAKDPDTRPQSASEFANEFDRAAGGRG
jgi:Protein kinase domain/GAF domain